MSTVKISALPLATPTGDDVVPGSLADSSASKKFKISDIVALASGGVSSVNGKTGAAVLNADDVTAVASVNGQSGTVTLSATDVTAVASINGLDGALTIAGGDGVTVTTSAGTITITGNTATGGGGSAPTTANVSTVTATQDNWDIGTADISFIYSGITNTINVTGLATASNTLPKLVINGSTHTSASFTIKHDDTNSTAALRILVPWAGDYVVSPNGGAALVVYDENQTRWRVV